MLFDWTGILFSLHQKANDMFIPKGKPSNPDFQTDIQKAQAGKLELESKIKSLIVGYECEFGLKVTGISQERSENTLGYTLRRVISVTVTL
jgi:hypothetical protein